MTSLLKEENIMVDPQFSMRDCSLDLKCRDYLTVALNLVKRVEMIFQRPFPKLGTWISFFAEKVFSGSGYDLTLTKIEIQAHSFLSKLLTEYYQQVPISTLCVNKFQKTELFYR